MTDANRLFTDLMSNWSEAQAQAWELQARLVKDAGAAFTEASRAHAGREAAGTSFEQVWTQSREAFEKWREYLDTVLPTGPEKGFGAEMLSHLMDPNSWLNIGISELNQSIETMAEGVRFANLWRTEREMLEASREWLDLRDHSQRYRGIIMAAWMRAFGRFSAHMAEDLRGADPSHDWQVAVSAWLEIANDELMHTQRSEEFLSAQRDLLRASIDFRARQQHLVEQMCEANAIPTRSEVDDLHRTVTELRRELRALKADLAAARESRSRPKAKARSKRPAAARPAAGEPSP